jgi:radical SAM protein with 4Fe4S-binding SPASM domain
MGGFSEENRSELSIKQIRKVLTEFEQMQGLRVLITGGEPLLHSRLEVINEMLPQFFIRKVLFTNGLLLDEERVKNLNVDEIQISIDGLEDAHDSLRGKGTFRLAMKAINLSLDHGFHVSIATMVHPGNLEDFDEMERLFKDMGIKEWTVDVPCATGRLEKNVEFQIRPEEGGRYLRYGYGGGLHTGEPGFACGLHLMAVMADGKVAKCTFYSDSSVGRVEEGLKVCWQRIKPIRLDELKCDCEYIESCRGGCRYRTELFGDPLGKDLYRCALHGII